MFGYLSEDDVQIGPFKVKKQAFAEVTKLAQKSSFEFDVNRTQSFNSEIQLKKIEFKKGILGMAYESISVLNVTTVFSNLVKQGQVKGNKFSFWLDR